MSIKIETKRLILREWCDDDIKPFAEINSNSNVMKYFPTQLSEKESNAFAERIMAEMKEWGIGLYAVEIKGISKFIGYVGFHRFQFEAPFSPGIEIGWRISDKFWHQGYATEAASACIDYARSNRLLTKLYSFTAVPNIASEKVMKRIGMNYEGNFMHPALPDGHWLKAHKLYSIIL